jgi:predicted extracellular nuclease
MKLIIFVFSLLFVATTMAQPVKWKARKYFTVVSYNVENLFDTISQSKLDEEFTPASKKSWNTERYYKKLNSIAQVIDSINPKELPEIIGLIEIENRTVLEDLIKTDILANGNYKIVHQDGPDPRGIDCALLYRSDAFEYLNHQAIEVRFPFADNKRTRDILYVKGLVNRDTLHFFVNHWSSRRGGEEASEPKRMQSALTLKNITDSITRVNPLAKIIIMGDFNDEPSDKSLKESLQAGALSDDTNLKNLLYEAYTKGKGSYYYRGDYNMIDNFVVSNPLLVADKGFRLYTSNGFVFTPEFICYTNKNGDKSPNRTYGGDNYYGGYSDHFPIYSIFYQK